MGYTYSQSNGVEIVAIPAAEFSIAMVNKRKKTADTKDYCNAGFFANFKEQGETFTLPVGHLVCDFESDSKWVKHYCQARGKFLSATKFMFNSGTWSYSNQFYKKALSTLIINNGTAKVSDIVDIASVPSSYAITGVPVIRSGQDVKFKTYVTGQGWDGSTLYATYHIFAGIKSANANTVYIMGWRSTTGNLIYSGEAYKKFKAMGFYDLIKLDGGGSYYMNINGKLKYTAENRLINTIVRFGKKAASTGGSGTGTGANPYPVPARTLKKGCAGDDVKWLQYQLYKHGYGHNVSGFSIDGNFGPATVTTVKAFQRANGLAVDGSVGPATRNALKALG